MSNQRPKTSPSTQAGPGRDVAEDVGFDTMSDQIRRDMAASAIRKRRCGEIPTAREIESLRWFEKNKIERDRRRYLATIPKKHWVKMSGKSYNVVNEQAQRYGIPVGKGKRTIDAGDVLRWVHQFLADNARKLSKPAFTIDDPLLAGSGKSSPALEEYRREMAKIKRIERQQLEMSLLNREVMYAGLRLLSDRIRSMIPEFNKRYGQQAVDMINECLEAFDRDMEVMFGNPKSSHETDDPATDPLRR